MTFYHQEFRSKKEGYRFLELKGQEQKGKIHSLKLQPMFLLQEGFVDKKGRKHRPITYFADFEYIKDGKKVYEDAKGMRTNEYKIKKKLLLFRYPDIDFREV